MSLLENQTIACIDVTQGDRAMDVTWVAGDSLKIQHARLMGVESVLAWSLEHLPKVLAIDAPCKRNISRTTNLCVRKTNGFDGNNFLNCRVCEAMLKQHNIQTYSTPNKNAAGWIQTGWQIYDQLIQEQQYQIWDTPGLVNLRYGQARVLVEVYPHASFVVGIGARPANKKTLPGQLERIAWLLRVSEEKGLNFTGDVWPDPLILKQCQDSFSTTTWQNILEQDVRLPNLPTHDTVDSLAGLLTACLCLDGTATAVGESEEGVIVLPKALQGQYLPFE